MKRAQRLSTNVVPRSEWWSGSRIAVFITAVFFFGLSPLFGFRNTGDRPEVPVAAGGYDVVTYRDKAELEKGSIRVVYTWNGYRWVFTERQHLREFQSDPWSYLKAINERFVERVPEAKAIVALRIERTRRTAVARVR